MANVYISTAKPIQGVKQDKDLSNQVILQLLLTGVLYGFFAAVTAVFLSPLQYVKIIRQETNAAYWDIVGDAFSSQNPVTIFFRGCIPYACMNFLCNMSFGFSNYFCNLILGLDYSILLGIIIRAVLGGVFETVFTIYPEIKEIIYNKGVLAKTNGQILQVIYPAAIRNTITWFGASFTYEISYFYFLDIGLSIILSFVFGILFGILSIPFDVITTRNCGSMQNLGITQRIYLITKNKSWKSELFSGSLIRIFQIGAFTAVTVLTMFFIKYIEL